MSFPKAKIKRFNESNAQAPSPGRYDPKLENKVKGAIIPMSKRFPNQTCTSSSLDCLEKATTSSEVFFRTPQTRKKKINVTPYDKHLVEKNFDTSDSSVLSSEEKKHVAFSISKKTVTRADYKRLEQEMNSMVEEHLLALLDRDLEIRKLKDDLENIKIHEVELKEILDEKTKLASERHNDLLELRKNLDTMVARMNIEREEHQNLINELKKEITSLQDKKYEYETVLAEKQSVIVTINDKYLDLENEVKYLQEINANLEEECFKIKDAFDAKIEYLEDNLKSKVLSLAEDFDSKYQQVNQDFQTRLNVISHEFDEKTTEILSKMKDCEKSVQECESMVNLKIKEFSNNIEEANDRCKFLYKELCKVESQRDELVVSDLEKQLEMIDIQELSESYKNDLDKCREVCKKYKITVNTMQETITALSTRLLESESEVERLNSIEEDLKSKIKQLEEKTQLLPALKEGMDKMEQEIISDVTALKMYLENKADNLKLEAGKKTEELKKIIVEKQHVIDILIQENGFFKKELQIKSDHIENLKTQINKCSEKILQLKIDRSKLEEEVSEKLNAQRNLYQILNQEFQKTKSWANDLNSMKMNYESKISDLIKTIENNKVCALESENKISHQCKTIQTLQAEIESTQEIIQKKKETEIKQQQYIDELISDLVLEKERCVVVESEKERIKVHLSDLEISLKEKTEEIEKLTSHIEALKLSLSEAKEKLDWVDKNKDSLEQQLKEYQVMSEELKNSNKIKQDLENKITELQLQLAYTKEKVKTEIPELERDNINKAEYILELSLNMDGLKEEINEYKTKILCLEAEKSSLSNVLEEDKSKISSLESALEDKNMKINYLNEEKDKLELQYKDLLSQFDSLCDAYNKQNEEISKNSIDSMKLLEAEEKIHNLEQELSDAIKESMEHRSCPLKEEFEVLQQKYDAVVADRIRLNQELADLLGHHNIHQKIKHVTQLKQLNIKLVQDVENLKVENTRLKKKLNEKENNKENVSINTSRPESTKKSNKPPKKPLSPSVLKPSNHH